jgi:hypothetical protein
MNINKCAGTQKNQCSKDLLLPENRATRTVFQLFAGKCFPLMNPVSKNPSQSKTPVLAKQQLARFRV